jgi:hypothetical protein
MAFIQRISSVSEIPAGRKHVLVTVGDKNQLTRQGENLIVTVDRAMPDNLFEARVETAISDAEQLADQEHVDTVFVCMQSAQNE